MTTSDPHPVDVDDDVCIGGAPEAHRAIGVEDLGDAADLFFREVLHPHARIDACLAEDDVAAESAAEDTG